MSGSTLPPPLATASSHDLAPFSSVPWHCAPPWNREVNTRQWNFPTVQNASSFRETMLCLLMTPRFILPRYDTLVVHDNSAAIEHASSPCRDTACLPGYATVYSMTLCIILGIFNSQGPFHSQSHYTPKLSANTWIIITAPKLKNSSFYTMTISMWCNHP